MRPIVRGLLVWLVLAGSALVLVGLILAPFGGTLDDRAEVSHEENDGMSFDIFFQPCRPGTVRKEGVNPFTNEPQTVTAMLPLTSSDLEAVRRVLHGVASEVPDEGGYYGVRLKDGGTAGVHADELASGCMVSLHGRLTPDLLVFLFDLLGAAEWVMLPAMEDNPAITTVAGRGAAFDTFPEMVCSSPEELGAILSSGHADWLRYRDQVIESGGFDEGARQLL